MPYQLVNESVLLDWVAAQTDSTHVENMLDFVVELAEDPYSGAARVPGQRAPVWWRPTPVPDTAITYLIAEEYHAVRLLRIDSWIDG